MLHAPIEFQSTEERISRWWSCTIIGAPRTKKTSQRIGRTKSGRPFILQSVQQTAWAQSARLQLQAAWRGQPPLACPVNLAAIFYREREQGDLDNYLAALQDVLQAERKRRRDGLLLLPGAVLMNDRQVKSHDGSRLAKDAARPRVELTLHWTVPVEP